MKTVATLTPPAVPKSADDAWAEALGVPNNVPPVPQQPLVNQPTQPVNPMVNPVQNPWQPNISNNQQPKSQAINEPMPNTYLVWSVICTILCCFIPGIVAIINSTKVSSKYFQGDIEGSKRASRNAEIWIIVSFVLGVITNTLYIPLSIAGLL